MCLLGGSHQEPNDSSLLHINDVKFDGTWFTLADGQLLAAELVNDAEGVKVYTAPVMVNNKETNLRFLVDENSKVTVLGTWDGISENGMAARGIRPIEAGSKVTPLYMSINTVTCETEMVKGDSVVVSNDIVAVDDMSVEYSFAAQVEDAFGNVTISTPVK